MKYFKLLGTFLIAMTAVIGLSACDGGGEDAGEKVDEVMTDMGNAVEDACEDVKEGVEAKDNDC